MKIKFEGTMDVPEDELRELLVTGPPVTETESPPKTKRRGKAPSLTSLKKKAVKMTNEGLVDELRAILKEYSIKQVANLSEDQYSDFNDALDQAFAEAEDNGEDTDG